MNDVRDRRIDRIGELGIVMIDLFVLPFCNSLDEIWLASRAEVREHRIRGDDVAHRYIVDAERNRRSVGEIAAESGLMPDVLDATHSDCLRDANGGNVERHLERFTHSHGSAELV